MRSDFYSLPYDAQQAIRRGEREAASARQRSYKIGELRGDNDRLRDALMAISSQAICYGMRADENELRDWLKFISETAEAALQPSK